LIEVELKARVRDRAAVRSSVASFARSLGPVDKLDEYWAYPGGADPVVVGSDFSCEPAGARPRGFRVREEGGRATVTRKEKRREGGLESNREIEFEVSDVAAFVDFALSLGCQLSYTKRKRGEAFEAASEPSAGQGSPMRATIELFEVVGLGDFIEIEILVPEGDPEASASAAREVRALLARVGVPESDLESRFYSELLAEAGLAPRS